MILRSLNCLNKHIKFRGYSTCKNFNNSETMHKSIIAVGQLTATNNKADNFNACKEIILKAAKQNASIVFLPEACDYVGESKAETLKLSEKLDGNLIQEYSKLAKENNVWLSLGGIHERISSDIVRNCHVIINSEGNIQACYRKTHLFDVEIPERQLRLVESEYVMAGDEIVQPVHTPVGKIGLGICYDLRFPEFSTLLAKMGADVLTFPSAFTYTTGSAHWEALLRSRAIENQCYVVAAAQTGNHNKKRMSWGHAMCIDPWGTVVAQCSENSNFVLAEIDLAYIQKVRENMPVMKHRRNDLYPAMKLLKLSPKPDKNVERKEYEFGSVSISSDIVFYKTALTVAFTNIRCVVPGHVLLMPIRKALRLCDLTSEEVSDLFCAVQKVQSVMERAHNVSSSTIVVQDGKDAGQTVEHVHVHILPRRPGDFERNDDIYVKLQNEGKEVSQKRTENEMAAEAVELRAYF